MYKRKTKLKTNKSKLNNSFANLQNSKLKHVRYNEVTTHISLQRSNFSHEQSLTFEQNHQHKRMINCKGY